MSLFLYPCYFLKWSEFQKVPNAEFRTAPIRCYLAPNTTCYFTKYGLSCQRAFTQAEKLKWGHFCMSGVQGQLTAPPVRTVYCRTPLCSYEISLSRPPPDNLDSLLAAGNTMLDYIRGKKLCQHLSITRILGWWARRHAVCNRALHLRHNVV